MNLQCEGFLPIQENLNWHVTNMELLVFFHFFFFFISDPRQDPYSHMLCSSPLGSQSWSDVEDAQFSPMQGSPMQGAPMEIQQYQRRIHQLEAQLREAHNRINSLQAELGKKNAQTKPQKVETIFWNLSLFFLNCCFLLGSKSLLDRRRTFSILRSSIYVGSSTNSHFTNLLVFYRYGAKDVKSIANHVGTRNTTQVRTHSQKYFLRLVRTLCFFVVLVFLIFYVFSIGERT